MSRTYFQPLSEERCKLLVEAYVAGATLAALSKKYGHSNQTILKKLNAAGVVRRRVRLEKGSDIEMQMLGAFTICAQWKEVGRLGGVSEDTAYKFLRKCGIDTTRSIRWKQDNRSNDIAADYAAGMLMSDIADKHGLRDVGQIYSVLDVVGVKKRRRRPFEKRGYVSLRDRSLFSSYGMRLPDYYRMLEKQGGACRLCGKMETRNGPTGRVLPLSVDHDHKTGKVRGLLCSNCNHGLGSFMDDPEMIERAIVYLEGCGGRCGL